MKESFYFSHDFSSSSDPKVVKMMSKHGMKGYGIYWRLIEMLAQETERWFLPKDYEVLAYEMRTQCECIKSVVQDFGLFEFDDKNLWNKRLDRHFDERAEKSDKARKSAEIRWKRQEKREAKNANALRPQSDSNAIKERKGKEKKTTKKKFVPPTLEDVKKYIDANGQRLDAEHIFKYYNDAGWKDSKGSQVLNWKQKIRGVWFKPEEKKVNLRDIKTVEELDEFLRNASDSENNNAAVLLPQLYIKSKYCRI